MGIFGKKEQKPKVKTPEEIKKEQDAFEKRQLDMLVALRTKAELKLEKSAIVTLGQMADVVRSQTLVNKDLQRKLNRNQAKFVEYNSRMGGLINQTFDNVDSLKAHIKILVDKYNE